MEERRKPQTQKDMVEQLWYCIIGTNGEGLAEQHKKLNRKLDKVSEDFSAYKETRAETCPIKRSKAERVGGWVTRVTLSAAILAFILDIVGVIN